MDPNQNILQTPYKQLPISNSLKRFFAIYEIPNLEKLLEIKSNQLLEMKWFNTELWRQLIVLLDENGHLEKLK